MSEKPDVVHSLISLTGPELYYHCYLMCPRSDLDKVSNWAYNRLMDQAEEMHVPVFPAICHTVPLEGPTIARIREFLSVSPQAAKLLKEATDHHMSMWYSPVDYPENEWLMAIH